MTNTKNIFLDKDLRVGGFYELAIQVCPSINNEPIRKYTDFIWTLENVEGPYDINFNKINVDIANIEHNGVLHLDKFAIPFKTLNICEDEPIETGFNWFDITFYTAAIENIFGEEYKVWTENQNCPEQINIFFLTTMKQLYKLFPFQLAIIDFEVSGMYYYEELKTDLTGEWLKSKFYVGQENYRLIAEINKKYVSIID